PELQNSLAAGYPNLVDSFQSFASEVAFKACQKEGTILKQGDVNKLKHSWIQLEEMVKEDAHREFAKRKDAISKMDEQEKLQKGRRVILSEEDFISMMQSRRQQFENDLPLKIRGGGHEFSHRSLFEYFVAKKLLQFLRNNEPDFISEEE